MEEFGLSDIFAVLRRWKKIFCVTTAILLVLSMSMALRWSNYRSTATVQVEQPEISADALSAGGGNAHDAAEAIADQRISTIEQKVVSTASLIEIITKFDLYAKARQHKPIAAIAESMQKNIKVDLISSAMANPAASGKGDMSAIAFKVSFDYGNALLTQQVTDELVTRFLDEDLKERRAEAQETADFLDAQIAAMETSMADQEKKIADYQNEHGVSRPENLAFNQQAAASATYSLQNLDSQMATNEGSLGALRAQLATTDAYARVTSDGQVLTSPSVQLKALQSQYATLTAQYGPEHPDVVKLKHQIEALQTHVGAVPSDSAVLKAHIIDVQTNLAAAQKTYGPNHPDVIALQNELNRLQEQAASQKTNGVADNGVIGDADNPAYLQIVAQLRAAEEQHKALQTQKLELMKQQESYQKAIIANPEAEKEMAALSRDYDNAQLRYRELKEKKMTADMDVQMQNDRKGQRLSLIDPPELPLDTHPARILMILGGVIFSLLGGLGSVFLSNLLAQSVIGPRQLAAITGSAPLVVIPHIYTQEERNRSLSHKIDDLRHIIARRLGLSP